MFQFLPGKLINRFPSNCARFSQNEMREFTKEVHWKLLVTILLRELNIAETYNVANCDIRDLPLKHSMCNSLCIIILVLFLRDLRVWWTKCQTSCSFRRKVLSFRPY